MAEAVSPQVECVECTEKYGRFVAEPLEKGYGVTVGNALRRVLFSSLSGVAVTWVKIDGVQHEFSTIPHMKEDTIEFLLNVKALRLRPLAASSGKLSLEAVGEGRIVAGDIKPSADFEVVNPELHLATLDSTEARLVVEFNVEQGKGYRRADRGNGLPIGVLPVDAIFSPIRKVNFILEPTRIGQLSTNERLILEVWTDGTISPVEAVSQAGRTLTEQFQLFLHLVRFPREAGEKGPRTAVPSEQYNMPLEQLNLSVRTFNCLRRTGITKVGDLLEKDKKELLAIRNFGQKAFQEVEEQLKALGLTPWGTEGEES